MSITPSRQPNQPWCNALPGARGVVCTPHNLTDEQIQLFVFSYD